MQPYLLGLSWARKSVPAQHRLKDAPVTAPSGLTLRNTEARNVVARLLYNEQFWPLIVEALTDALAGDYGLFFQFAPLAARFIRPALETSSFDAFDAILCNDDGTRRPAAEYLAVDEAVGARCLPHRATAPARGLRLPGPADLGRPVGAGACGQLRR